MDNLASFALYDRDWSAQEELLLLDGIEMYGLGNWRDVATFVATKSETACFKHYMAVYLESPTAPLPSGDPTTVAVRGGGGSSASAGGGGGGSGAGEGGDGSSGSGEGALFFCFVLLPPPFTRSHTHVDPPPHTTRAGRSSSSNLGTPGYSHAHIPKTEVAGYMPLRGDFDIEHDNDAEAILADMDFAEGEHATETELKLKILEIYNAKLDERERRKAFVIERGLLEYKRMLAVERRRPREEREVYDAFRPFARFMSPAEHEELVRGIILENRLRKRIVQLQEYRKAGIRSLAEAQEYEASKRRREATQQSRRAGGGGGGAGGGSSGVGVGGGGGSGSGGGRSGGGGGGVGGGGGAPPPRRGSAVPRPPICAPMATSMWPFGSRIWKSF